MSSIYADDVIYVDIGQLCVAIGSVYIVYIYILIAYIITYLRFYGLDQRFQEPLIHALYHHHTNCWILEPIGQLDNPFPLDNWTIPFKEKV